MRRRQKKKNPRKRNLKKRKRRSNKKKKKSQRKKKRPRKKSKRRRSQKRRSLRRNQQLRNKRNLRRKVRRPKKKLQYRWKLSRIFNWRMNCVRRIFNWRMNLMALKMLMPMKMISERQTLQELSDSIIENIGKRMKRETVFKTIKLFKQISKIRILLSLKLLFQ